MRRAFILVIFVLSWSELHAQYTVSVQKVSNYNPYNGTKTWGTGWDSVIVMKNSLITLATVPKVGGRVMQYDLGQHPTIFIDTTKFGVVPTSNPSNPPGGSFTHVSPQSSWNSGGWPPPNTLHIGNYSPTITKNTPDTGSIYLESSIESESGYPNLSGLQYKKTVTLFKASTRVNIAITLLNKGTSTTLPAHGIWEITECLGGSPGLPGIAGSRFPFDTMMWVYFPMNPNSRLGGGRGYVRLQNNNDTSQLVRNAGGPGIMGLQYKKKQALLGADDSAGWICYNDRRDGYAFAKRFIYQSGKTYPDSGSSISLYTDGGSAGFIEVEVKGPVSVIAPGDSLTYVEDWYQARSPGPIAWVNDAGVITRHLSALLTTGHDSVRVSGSFGVFYPGFVKSVFINSSGTPLSAIDSTTVTPFDSLVLSKTLKVPTNAAKLLIADYNAAGTLVAYLDSSSIGNTGIETLEAMVSSKGSVGICIRHGGSLEIHADFSTPYSIDISRLDGRRVASFSDRKPRTFSYGVSRVPTGIYLVRTRSLNTVAVQKVFLGK